MRKYNIFFNCYNKKVIYFILVIHKVVLFFPETHYIILGISYMIYIFVMNENDGISDPFGRFRVG